MSAVDELISARRKQHGGSRGAPPILNGARVGSALNKSSIVMLSALLQGHVEAIFLHAARGLLPHIEEETYRKSFRNWGNPTPDNIERLFSRLGLENPLKELSWRNCTNETLFKRLRELNEMRNRIAHGQKLMTGISLTYVEQQRDFVKNFAEHFGPRVRKMLPRKARH
jgi:RiboL-PSP-HEPN